MFSSEVSAVAGWLPEILYVRGKKMGKLVVRSFFFLGGGITQKQGVGFPAMEKNWFGVPRHLSLHTDRLGVHRTRAEEIFRPAALEGKVACM